MRDAISRRARLWIVIIIIITTHRSSTSMYLLTFRVRVATPAQYGRNGTASLQITRSRRVDFIAGACVRV